ncbi:MAG: hypothetical protein H0U69_05710 [Trueperaceae bacterium]|nr:hypothetical protein [Trueperaceae bacterium]
MAADVDLVRVAHRCLRDLAEIDPEHHVLVVTDDETNEVAAAWAAAAAALAAEVVTLRMDGRRRHGEEPPPIVASAMLAADVIVQAVARALTHTDASRAAMAAGAQIFVLRGITAEMMRSDLMRVDYAALRRVTAALAALLESGAGLHLTSPAGTDLRCSVAGRTAFALAGGTGPGRFGGARSRRARRQRQLRWVRPLRAAPRRHGVGADDDRRRADAGLGRRARVGRRRRARDVMTYGSARGYGSAEERIMANASMRSTLREIVVVFE